MSRFLRGALAAIESYVPGEQPQDKKYIKLNTNESPYPPPQSVIDAIGKAEIEDLRLYSDPKCKDLKNAIAREYGVSTERIFVSNGSDEILNFAFLAYGEKGAAFPDITYGFYAVLSGLYGVQAEVIPLREDFTVDVDAFCGQNRLVVLANPNAPTGIALKPDELEKIVASNPDGVVIIDEAYVDFGTESVYRLTEQYHNLLVAQTFSKSRSMAGARLGFAFGDPEIIADLETIKDSTNPYNINRLTQLAGTATLADSGYFKANCQKTADTREYLKRELAALGFTVTDSAANFVFAKSEKIGGAALYKALRDRGILVRHFETARIRDYNRITVGSRAEADALLAAVRKILEEEE